MDKAYDLEPLYHEFEKRDCHPVIPLREDTKVKKGWAEPPRCKHGVWEYGGTEYGRKATKWRCPKGKCQPSHRWIKPDRFDPLIPRSTRRYRKLTKGRAAVEREFGRLKDRWKLAPLRVRRLKRVQLHADLTILAKLSCALARARLLGQGTGDLRQAA
jgi:hypothetical protein